MATDFNEVDPGLDPSKAKIILPRVRCEAGSGTRVAVSSRDHRWVIDEPAEKGGSDEGPTPLESLLGSLVGCESVVLRLVADTIGFRYSNLVIDCEGTADLRGARGVKGVRPYFTRVSMEIALTTDEGERRIDLLRRNVELRCPVMNLFESADVEMNIRWTILPEEMRA